MELNPVALMMCQHVIDLNVPTFPFAQFEIENVLSLVWLPTMNVKSPLSNLDHTHYSICEMTADRPEPLKGGFVACYRISGH